MQEYRIGPEGIKALRKLLLKRMLFLVPVVLAIVIFNLVSYSLDKPTDMIFYLIPIFIFLLVYGALLFRVIKKNERLFKSYVLTIENILIRREQLNTQDVDIYFNEIVEISKSKNGWLTVKGKYAGDVIFIPAQIENFGEVERILTEIKPITSNPVKSTYEKYAVFIFLIGFASMICSMIVTNKIIVGLCAALFSYLMIRYFIYVRKNKNIDNKTKRRFWFILVIAGFIVLNAIIRRFEFGMK
jgi:peptidoglycan/LPS O-acetylase OafA/YrhL